MALFGKNAWQIVKSNVRSCCSMCHPLSHKMFFVFTLSHQKGYLSRTSFVKYLPYSWWTQTKILPFIILIIPLVESYVVNWKEVYYKSEQNERLVIAPYLLLFIVGNKVATLWYFIKILRYICIYYSLVNTLSAPKGGCHDFFNMK